MKVYCKDCKFYLGKRYFDIGLGHEEPACLVVEKTRKYVGKDITGEPKYTYPLLDKTSEYDRDTDCYNNWIVYCELFNENYKCKFYQRKWYKFWIKK